jgi:hypothetical protein
MMAEVTDESCCDEVEIVLRLVTGASLRRPLAVKVFVAGDHPVAPQPKGDCQRTEDRQSPQPAPA